ncbi:MAG: hypothetical protein HY735_34980 [Verrucomicrobia bacterium]|nr:hypothetical protein [Verrucomicrobiota bacterium]
MILTVAADSGEPSSKNSTIRVTAPPPPSEVPTITVIASDANASEASSDSGEFTFTRAGNTDMAVTVQYDLAGSATKWNDYRRPQGDMPVSITIPAGAASAKLVIVPVEDTEIEGSETVSLRIVPDSGCSVGSPSTADILIADNDQPPPSQGRPTVTVEATDPSAAEAGPDTGTFTIRLSSPSASPITVRYTMGEEAKNGVDYQTLSGSVTVPAGAASATVTVIPIDDTAMESNEPLMLMLYGYTGAPYLVGRPDGATAKIVDDDP